MADRERKLTTIVAIDVAGYSRLMHADETGTLDRLKQARAISDPIGRAHGGRIVGTSGDGVLGSVDIHFKARNATTRWIAAA